MEKIISGSLPADSLSEEEIKESLDILMQDDQFFVPRILTINKK